MMHHKFSESRGESPESSGGDSPSQKTRVDSEESVIHPQRSLFYRAAFASDNGPIYGYNAVKESTTMSHSELSDHPSDIVRPMQISKAAEGETKKKEKHKKNKPAAEGDRQGEKEAVKKPPKKKKNVEEELASKPDLKDKSSPTKLKKPKKEKKIREDDKVEESKDETEKKKVTKVKKQKKEKPLDIVVVKDKPQTPNQAAKPKDTTKPTKSPKPKKLKKVKAPRNESEVYLVDGLNLFKFLVSVRIPGRSKLLIVVFFFTFISSLATNVAEITVVGTSTCQLDYMFWVYLNFSSMIILKVLTLSMINLELIQKTPYKQQRQFLLPFCIFGFFPLLQWSQNAYDYYTCEHRNLIFDAKYTEKISQALGVFALLYIAWKMTLAVGHCMKSTLLDIHAPRCRSFFLFLLVFFLAIFHSQTILLGLGQANRWDANLFLEYFIYYIMFGFLLFVTVKKFKNKDYDALADFKERPLASDSPTVNLIDNRA